MHQTATFDRLFSSEGAVPTQWQQATRCDCYSDDSRQPTWGCPQCHGQGVLLRPAQAITALFRSQSRWKTTRGEGELSHGDASMTVRANHQPGYVDRRVRDRYTFPVVVADRVPGTVFVPAGPPTPFIFDGEHLAWRVQVQSWNEADKLVA